MCSNVGPSYKGDEYEQLLQYVAYEAERSKRGGDEEEDEEEKEKRLWYAPWRKVKISGSQDRKVSLYGIALRVWYE